MSRYTLCQDVYRQPALLFDSLETERIALAPELAALFPGGYFINPVNALNPRRYRWQEMTSPEPKANMLLVSPSLSLHEPDQASLDSPTIHFYVGGKQRTINLHKRYNECLSLFKAVGCKSCPEVGTACLSAGAEGLDRGVPVTVPCEVNDEDLLEKLKKEKPTIGGCAFVDPMHTRLKSFTERIRPYWEHDFSTIEDTVQAMSDRGTKAAATRRFKKTECLKCLLKASCPRASYCKGAYPPEEDIVRKYDGLLTSAMCRSELAEWQIWELAREHGSTAKHSRWQVILMGVKLNKDHTALVPSVYRAKGSIRPYEKLQTYEQIAGVFNLLNAPPKESFTVVDPSLRATWWLALVNHNARESLGWGNSQEVIGSGVNQRVVTVQWGKPRYISRYATSEMTSISQVAKIVGHHQLDGVEHVVPTCSTTAR